MQKSSQSIARAIGHEPLLSFLLLTVSIKRFVMWLFNVNTCPFFLFQTSTFSDQRELDELMVLLSAPCCPDICFFVSEVFFPTVCSRFNDTLT